MAEDVDAGAACSSRVVKSETITRAAFRLPKLTPAAPGESRLGGYRPEVIRPAPGRGSFGSGCLGRTPTGPGGGRRGVTELLRVRYALGATPLPVRNAGATKRSMPLSR